jgi:hypothetical protein
MTEPENTGGKQETTRWRKGVSGNPAGKPKGTRHKVTMAVQALLDGEADALTRKCIELAKEGDTTVLRLCMERLAPAMRSRAVELPMPTIDTADDVLKAQAATIRAMAAGKITPGEAATIAGVLDAKRKAIETIVLEERVAKLERQAVKRNPYRA